MRFGRAGRLMSGWKCRSSQSKFATRAEADEFENVVTELAINQDQIRPDMAITVVLPFACELMIDIARRQQLIGCQKRENRREQRLQFLAEDA